LGRTRDGVVSGGCREGREGNAMRRRMGEIGRIGLKSERGGIASKSRSGASYRGRAVPKGGERSETSFATFVSRQKLRQKRRNDAPGEN